MMCVDRSNVRSSTMQIGAKWTSHIVWVKSSTKEASMGQ